MSKPLKVKLTVNVLPHPNPDSAINLVAEIIVKQLLKGGIQNGSISIKT